MMEKFVGKWANLAYRFEGRGDQNYVFVHNAGGNHQLMKDTISYFNAKGGSLSLDLRGHGQSEAPKLEYTLEAYAQDVFDLCCHCKMEKIVLIGLNFGGNVGVALNKLHPNFISRLVLIEPPMLMEPWIVQSVEEHIEDLKDESTVNYAVDLVNAVITDAPHRAKEIAIKAFQTTPRHVQISTYENLLKWDLAYRNETVITEVPTLYIQTSKPFCKEESLQKRFSNLHTGRVIGSGPWASLEVPDQLNQMIDRFLSLQY